jgi:NDP-mannose synthase
MKQGLNGIARPLDPLYREHLDGVAGISPSLVGDPESRRNGHPRPEATKAVILAGGKGTRLAPYTSIVPKPLMPIGDRCILEMVVEQLARHDFTDVTLCVGYLAHLIRAVFDARSFPGLEVTYAEEEAALGTAAPLRLVDGLDDTFLLMNGDVLTTLDHRDLVRHHRRHGNMLTIASQTRRIKLDYGVLHLDADDGCRVCGWREKPEISSIVSMGIYVLEPEAVEYVPDESYFDFPDLVQAILRDGERVGAYLYNGLWFDIGRTDDYQRAVATWEEHERGLTGQSTAIV